MRKAKRKPRSMSSRSAVGLRNFLWAIPLALLMLSPLYIGGALFRFVHRSIHPPAGGLTFHTALGPPLTGLAFIFLIMTGYFLYSSHVLAQDADRKAQTRRHRRQSQLDARRARRNLRIMAVVILAIIGFCGLLLRAHVQIQGRELKAVGVFQTQSIDLDSVTGAVIGYSSSRIDLGYRVTLRDRAGQEYTANFEAEDLAMILVHLPADTARCHVSRIGGMDSAERIRLHKTVVAAAARSRRQPPESCVELARDEG